MDVYQRRRLVALACIIGFVVLMIILISSCGSDEEPATTTTGATGETANAAMTKAQFIDMADSICSENQAMLDSLAASSVATDPIAYSAQRSEYVRGQRRQLKNLTPPEEDSEQLELFYTALDEYTSLVRQSAGANSNNDTVVLAELTVTIPAASEQLRIAAEDFGFNICGQPSSGNTSEGGVEGGTVDGGVTPVDPGTVDPAPVDPGTVDPAPTDPGTGGGGGGAGL